jgi:hypothetical protein
LNEPLPEWAVKVNEAYLQILSEQGNRMLHYILAICTREMRHLNVAYCKPTLWAKIEKENGLVMVDWLKKVKEGGEDKLLQRWFQTPPSVTSAQYIQATSTAFHQPQGGSKPWSGSYGGKPWGIIADTAASFLTGHTSLEALVDTGYTLAHNTSPIFNKGMMYNTYDHHLITVLDVQRSGQMPELVVDPSFSNFHDAQLATMIKLVSAQFPDKFRGYVDWFKVEELGAVGKYSHYKEQQKKLHPAEPAVKKVVKQGVQGLEWKQVGQWDVWPGVSVPKFEREAVTK